MNVRARMWARVRVYTHAQWPDATSVIVMMVCVYTHTQWPGANETTPTPGDVGVAGPGQLSGWLATRRNYQAL